ncbi:MAG: beta-propeller domain-containing protein [Peptococcaceae bacterium]|nr:beta-propeller domain-containing protein [Peptococcaceae bacterium]
MPGSRKIAIVFVIVAAVIAGQYFYPRQSVAGEPRKFKSRQELADYVRTNVMLARFGDFAEQSVARVDFDAVPGAARLNEAASGSRSVSGAAHSATNVQVEGVDEADIIKNDGQYLYIISGGRVHIMEAYPAEKARLLSTVRFDGHPAEMYVNGSRLVVIGQGSQFPGTLVSVYDVDDRSRPVEVRKLAWEGGCAGSRMIGNRVCLVLNMPVTFQGDEINLPRIMENSRTMAVPPEEIYCFDCPDHSYLYTMIVSVNIADDGQESSFKTFLTGASQHIYASSGNLYLAGEKAPETGPLVDAFIGGLASLVDGETSGALRSIGSLSLSPAGKLARAEQLLENYMAGLDYAACAALEEKIGSLRDKFYRDMARERNKTVIYKYSLRDGGVEYQCRGEINGKLLNQFSMDEDGGYFRAATTSQGFLIGERPVTRNNVYVMDEGLNVVGRLEGLAPAERIYSARFMGGRAYLVTFRQVDPLFVIDLKDPQNPRVLGELKIPGYSDYLHPYDENHLIGVGKEVSPAPEPRPLPVEPSVPGTELVPPPPARQQGVKVALFDVSNPARPVEISKYVVDHPYSDSEVSRNHKAFLFSRAKNLMALPVTCPEYRIMSWEKIFPPVYRDRQGMYVFDISPEKGIKLRGKISHPPVVTVSGYEAVDPVRRAAYINDIFYTVSDGAVKLSRMEDLKEIKLVRLPGEN